ncbi:hypothetical protein ACIRPP_30055 [Streptomyces sp. NPDC101219]|uniref:hypothetical protein n=1 Tax=Streptomyces sp. NPDC101219 TaxID=3366131 RepID=UPI0037F93633
MSAGFFPIGKKPADSRGKEAAIMLYIEAANSRDMETFISELSRELQLVKADVYVDLYVDEPLSDEGADESFRAMIRIATQKEKLDRRSRIFGRRDPLMGVKVDLRQGDQAVHFSRIAHRIINAEGWCDDRQVFGTVGSSVRIWVDMPTEVIKRVLLASEAAGAIIRVNPSE